MNKLLVLLFSLLFFIIHNARVVNASASSSSSSASSTGICSQDGTSCIYPQGWDVCLTCTSSHNCNGNPCVQASLLSKESGCYGIANKACNCSAATANAPCAQGNGCCYTRLSYKWLQIWGGVLGWAGGGSFYLGRLAEFVLHVIVIVLGAVAIGLIYSYSVQGIEPQDQKENTRQRCTCCIYRPTCTPRFALFWTILSLYLLTFFVWWFVDLILYTENPIYDAYNLQLYN